MFARYMCILKFHSYWYAFSHHHTHKTTKVLQTNMGPTDTCMNTRTPTHHCISDRSRSQSQEAIFPHVVVESTNGAMEEAAAQVGDKF